MTKGPSDKKSHYIWIPDTNICIAREQVYDALNHEEALSALGRGGRYFMPSPKQFMPFYNSLIAAEQGRITLHTGADKPLTKKEVNELYERFVLGKHGGIWAHLDAYFIQDSRCDRLNICTDHRFRREGTSTIVAYQERPLEKCVDSNGLVSLIFNGQGFPTTKSEHTEWQPGKSIYFWPPQKECVARFVAYAIVGASGAGLYCDGGPRESHNPALKVSYPALGVLACAEGKPRRKN